MKEAQAISNIVLVGLYCNNIKLNETELYETVTGLYKNNKCISIKNY